MLRISFAFTLLLLVSCSPNQKQEHTDESTDTIPVSIEYAENFTLKQKGNTYILELLNPGTKEVQHTYTIHPDNNRIISLTSTMNGMLVILSQQEKIIGISEYDFVHDSIIKKRYNDGLIKEYGDQTRNSVEKLISSNADIILHDIVDSEFPNQDKLEKLGIKVLPIFDWREQHPLAKAEWIKVMGAITGKMEEANAHFDRVVENYNRLKAYGTSFETHPEVLCGTLIGDIWYTPSGENYFARLVKDAGGAYKYADTKGTESLKFSIEQILKDNKDTEYWLNPGFASKASILKINPHAKFLSAFENDRIYGYSKRMNLFWEQSAAYPDRVLSDLIHVLHPEQNEIEAYFYYQKI